jgi:hypothetical protein
MTKKKATPEKSDQKLVPAICVGHRPLDDMYSSIAWCFMVGDRELFFSKVKHVWPGQWYYIYSKGKDEQGQERYASDKRPASVPEEKQPFQATEEQLQDWEALDVVTRQQHERTKFAERYRKSPPHLKDLSDLPRICAGLKHWQREVFGQWLVGELARRWKEKQR